MTTSGGGRRYDLDQRQSASGSQLSALLTKSTLQSPPAPDSHRRPERGYDTAPDHPRQVQRTLPSPQLPPSAAMQIPQRPHRDSFNFTSPLQSTSHSDRSPHSHPNDSHPRHPTLTRHESFSYPYPSSSSASDNARPRPPPLRTAHSAYASRVQGPQSPTDESGMGLIEEEDGKRDGGGVDMEELTTKGRKRKRLAKACSACHKNKRRCDGFAPCSNCEFSSRPCLYLNAMGETIPPPRTRDGSGQSGGAGAAAVGAGQKGGSKPMSQTGSGHGSQGQNRTNGQDGMSGIEEQRGFYTEREDGRYDVGRTGCGGRMGIAAPAERRRTVVEVVDEDPILSAELIDTFFRTASPFNAMFHPATFHHRHYLNQTGPILRDAMYAFAARVAPSPALIACYPPNHPTWLRGELFAERAHAEAERIVAARAEQNESDMTGQKRGTWEELEEIQAFSILSIYFACLRQPVLALFYLDTAIAMLRPSTNSPIPRASELSAVEQATLGESRNRTFWLVALHDLCAAANGRQRMLAYSEMEGIPLPGGEGWWVRFGGAGRDAKEGEWRQRDGLVPGSGNWAGDEGQVGELGHVLRILSIFSDIMAVANGGGAGSKDVRLTPLHQHQEALKSWAQSLPVHLQFDEHNLSTSVAQLNSPLPHVALSGWAFGYMHAVAECGMFYLQAAVAQQPGASWTAQRQSQAVDNIAVVLDAMGEKGREGPLLIFPIAVVSNWQDHLRSTLASPTPQQLLLDERLNTWWIEAKQQWGVERAQVLDRGFYPGAQGSVLSGYNAPERNDQPYQRGSAVLHGASYGNGNGLRLAPRGYEEPSTLQQGFVQQYDIDRYDRRYSDQDREYEYQHRARQSLDASQKRDRPSPSSSHHLRHLLDPSPVPMSSGAALGSYGAAETSPRDLLSSSQHRRSPEVYLQTNPYARSRAHTSETHPGSYHLSPPELGHSSSTSTSLLLPTPFSSRPNLPPLPSHGARPRATSSVLPYSITRTPSPNMPPANLSTSVGGGSSGQRYYPNQSFSGREGNAGKTGGSDVPVSASSAGAGGFYLPPSAELRQLRRLDEVPRLGSGSAGGLGLGLGVSKGWRDGPFSPPRDSHGSNTSNATGAEPLGIAALISAAESEREKEEKRRESEGRLAEEQRQSPAGSARDGAEVPDVEMREEMDEAASRQQAAVMA